MDGKTDGAKTNITPNNLIVQGYNNNFVERELWKAYIRQFECQIDLKMIIAMVKGIRKLQKENCKIFMCNTLYPCRIYRKWVYHATYEHKDEKPWQHFLEELWSKENCLHFEVHNFKSIPLKQKSFWFKIHRSVPPYPFFRLRCCPCSILWGWANKYIYGVHFDSNFASMSLMVQ